MAGKPETWVEQPERRGYLEWLLKRTRAQLAGWPNPPNRRMRSEGQI